MSHQTTALVFVLSCRLFPDAQACIEFCLAHGYRMVGVIRDDWLKACEYLYEGKADVLVVADERSLDPNRSPRVEVVAHEMSEPTRADVPAGHRGSSGRPDRSAQRVRTSRIIRRGAGA